MCQTPDHSPHANSGSSRTSISSSISPHLVSDASVVGIHFGMCLAKHLGELLFTCSFHHFKSPNILLVILLIAIHPPRHNAADFIKLIALQC
ncbi:MAG: hypothetical protein EZS28_051427 [Streblomastix strix]|uniref:Uncharacterized protein n=1 Tax=Streblomastix strix TaxID=222440 RepID=A0A5J4T437_9EUKA|nr:MAG: hypothetical protein EZS28_051427 [Streblomastix strix]